MLAQKNTIRKQKEIERLFKQGRSSFDAVLGVKALPNETGATRAVVVVSTKVSKKAVERNTVKRRLSEIIRRALPRLREGVDMFVLALPAAKAADYPTLEASLIRHFRRLGIIKR